VRGLLLDNRVVGDLISASVAEFIEKQGIYG
jgi:hypothetical protein